MLKFIERTFNNTSEVTKTPRMQTATQCDLDTPYLARDGYVVKEISFEEFARAFQKYAGQLQNAA